MNQARVTIAVLAVVTIIASRARPSDLALQRASDVRPLLLRSSLASTVSKAHLPLLLDLYWLRAMIGTVEPETEERNRRLGEYATFLTDLDPRFFHAYYYLGLAIPYSVGGDSYLNGEQALALVRKGIARFPTDYRLRMQHAFLLNYIEHDPGAAAREFLEIAKLPNAPPVATAAATALFVDEGRFDEAVELISRAIEGRPGGASQVLLDRKKQLVIERLLRELDAAIERTRQKTGQTPDSLDEVVAAGEWPAEVTHDPEGGELTVEAGRGRSSWLVGRLKGIGAP